MSVDRVQAGLWAIEVPIARNPWRLESAMVYAVESGGGLVLIDAGWDGEESFGALVEGLAVLGAEVSDIDGILLTHVHPDHSGLSGRIRERSGAWVALHDADVDVLRQSVADGARREVDWLRACGVPDHAMPGLEAAADQYRARLNTARPDRVLRDRERVGSDVDLQVEHTPGHTPGHVCFHDADRRVLFSGDHLLARITPNIPHDAMATPDPLADFLASLARTPVGGDLLVLPGHERSFRDGGSRAEELRRHHRDHLEVVLAQVAPVPTTTWAIAERLPWVTDFVTMDRHVQRSALAETMAHLVHLAALGRISRQGTAPVRWSRH